MRSDFISKDPLQHILYALTTENRLACRVALETGLRIGDVLSLKSSELTKKSFTVTEEKTKKKRRIRLSSELKLELNRIKGDVYIFEHRFDPNKHRSRQAVYNDLKRAQKLFRIKGQISPHSLRKAYAVDLYRRYGDVNKVMQALNHESELVTYLYIFADRLANEH